VTFVPPPTAAEPPNGSGADSSSGRGAQAFRRRLAIGGLIAVVVLVGVGVLLAWRQYDDSKEKAVDDLYARVYLAKTVFDVYFAGQLATLNAIAAAPVVQSGDGAAMYPYFKRIQGEGEKQKLFNGGLGWVNREGVSSSSDTSPRGAAIDVSDRDYFKEAIEGKPYISEGLTSKVRKAKIMVMSVPSRDASGRINGVVAGSRQFETTGTNQKAIDLGYEGLVVLDRLGQNLALASFAKPENAELAEKVKKGEGVLTGVKGLENQGDRVIAYANSPLPGWTMVIDRSSSSVYSSARRALTIELVAIGISALVVLALIGWAVVRSRRELESERAGARRWEELSQSLGEAAEPSEVTGALISALASAFPRACVIVALESEDRSRLELSAVRPGDGGPAVRRDDPVAMELARLAYDAGAMRAARDPVGVRETVPGIDDELASQVGSIYALPLLTRGGRPLGAVTLLLPRDHVLQDSEEGVVAAQADHAGRALTRARRYEQEHDVAVALQRSLLPETLPEVEGIEIAGRYSAGGPGLEVGGDWYDALRRPDGILHFTVGDVAGRGIAAAVLMGQLRNAYRALALEHTSPAEIARRMLRHVPDAGMATAVFITLDPYTGELAYSSAGHPPILLHDAAEDAVTALDGASSPPLGWAQGKAIGEARLSLGSPATLLAYTDGLVERRGVSIDAGIDRLRELLRRTRDLPAGEACDTVLGEVLSATPADDDMALLLVRIAQVPSTMAIEVPSDPAMMRTLRLRVGTWLERRGVADDQRADTVLAITEACNNAIEHGYRGQGGTIELTLEHRTGKLKITVEDEGMWREPRLDPTRGRGLVIMKSTMHRADITPSKTGTRVDLELRLPGGRVAALASKVGSDPAHVSPRGGRTS
jgi:serine phosphatase RsbU (regulator of sigma subunit)/anti-sigma regulatory factor (Ser/Thr protein kinase)